MPSRLRVLHLIGYPLSQGGHIHSCLDLLNDFSGGSHRLIGFNGVLRSKYELVVELDCVATRRGYLVKLLRQLVQFKPDIIHCWDYNALKLLMKVRLVYSGRVYYTKAGGEPIKTYLPQFDGFIVFSKELMTYYAANKAKNLLLISQRLNLSAFPERQSRPVADGLTIGIFMRHSKEKLVMFKNLVNILKGVSLKKVRLHVAGTGNYTEDIISSLNLVEGLELIYHGLISDRDQLSDLREQCDVVVGHGRGVIEAAAMGIPILLLGYKSSGSSFVDHLNFNEHATLNMSGRSISDIGHSETIRILENQEYVSGNFDIRQLISKYYSSKIGSKILERSYITSMDQRITSKRLDLKWLLRFLAS